MQPVVEVVELDGAHAYHGHETQEEHQRAYKTEEVHRLGSEFAGEP